MVDYKKWDKFIDNLSDSDEERGPKVTKLTNATSFVIGPNGTSLKSTEKVINSQILNNNVSKIPSSWTDNGGLCGNFGHWCQTKEQIIIRCYLNENIKSKDILVTYDVTQKILKFTHCDEILIEGKLRYDITLNNLSECLSIIDWEIKTLTSMKYIEITLNKKSPIDGLVIWWECVFIDDEVIDLNKIKGRNSSSTSNVWEEAHRLFKEKVQHTNRELIDINDNDD